MRVEFITPANLDFLGAVDFYEAQAAGLGRDFIQDVEGSIDLITEFPLLGTPAPAGTRRLHLHRFPYSLVYKAEVERILVIAVDHHSRRPDHWRDHI